MSLEIKSNPEEVKCRREFIEGDLQSFRLKIEDKFLEEDKKRILQALDFMLEIHLPQKNRSDGRPFASHPLAVAEKVLEMDPDKNLIISALLHDSVEDQYDHVFVKRVNRRFTDKKFIHLEINSENKVKYKEILRTWSFREIRELFGSEVEYYVENMTNHDFNSLAEDLNLKGEEKRDFVNRLYSEHVDMIISDSKLFTLKLADLTTNIDLHSLPDDSYKKEKLKKKYKAVIENFIFKLEDLSHEHPLFLKKTSLLLELKKIYKNQYSQS